MVELRQTAEGARHHSSRVEQDQHALLPLGLVLDAHGPAAACGRGPRDRTRVVVGLVFAQTFEERAGPGDARAALTCVIRESTPEAHLVAADLLQGRIDVRGRVRGNPAPSPQEAAPAAPAATDAPATETSPTSWPRG